MTVMTALDCVLFMLVCSLLFHGGIPYPESSEEQVLATVVHDMGVRR